MLSSNDRYFVFNTETFDPINRHLYGFFSVGAQWFISNSRYLEVYQVPGDFEITRVDCINFNRRVFSKFESCIFKRTVDTHCVNVRVFRRLRSISIQLNFHYFARVLQLHAPSAQTKNTQAKFNLVTIL